jgi:hypothetical protein
MALGLLCRHLSLWLLGVVRLGDATSQGQAKQCT